jgi:7-keto-8-aminopelargonate synthetase-like enzyme
VYRHADPAHVDELLASRGAPAIVVTDTVFSMDGDLAPVEKLAEVCADRGALLVLDEAHAVLSRDVQLAGTVVRVGTLSKTLGSLGGFAAGPRVLVDLLVNRARSYIFTTASTPADMAAASAALAIVRGPEGDALRARLRRSVDRVRPGHPSPVLPVVLGDEAATIAASAALLERGLLVPAIRPPTVAPGSSRLRVAMSAAHTDDQVDALLAGLDACAPGWRD